MDHVEVEGTTIRVVVGDLTAQPVDAIVNAANEQLAHGGGVAAAIARAGAPDVDRESSEWVAEHGPLRPGVAAVTSAGAMHARFVIHVAGPRYRAGRPNAELLTAAVRAALDAASEAGVRSLALPAISSGIFGYPRRAATGVIADAVVAWAKDHPGSLAEVILVGFEQGTADDFRDALDRS